jgi:hypothetical protein
MTRSLLFDQEGCFVSRKEIVNQLLSRNEAARSIVAAAYGVAKLLAAAEAGYLRELEPHLEQACQTLSEEGLFVNGEIVGAIPPRRTILSHIRKEAEDGP